METLPLEIIKEIFSYLNFISKIRIRRTNKNYNKNLVIKDFMNIEKKYLSKLTKHTSFIHQITNFLPLVQGIK